MTLSVSSLDSVVFGFYLAHEHLFVQNLDLSIISLSTNKCTSFLVSMRSKLYKNMVCPSVYRDSIYHAANNEWIKMCMQTLSTIELHPPHEDHMKSLSMVTAHTHIECVAKIWFMSRFHCICSIDDGTFWYNSPGYFLPQLIFCSVGFNLYK